MMEKTRFFGYYALDTGGEEKLKHKTVLMTNGVGVGAAKISKGDNRVLYIRGTLYDR